MSDLKPEAVIPTSVPGLVLWRYPRMTFTQKDGTKKRSRSYSLTHEPSGFALLPGGGNYSKHFLTLAPALKAARQLGDVRWRGKPVDWTAPADQLPDRARVACFTVAGFRMLFERYDKETLAWADRNGIDLTFLKKKEKKERAA